MNQMRFRLIFVSVLTVLGLLAGVPSVVYFSLPPDVRNDPAAVKAKLPKWLPASYVNLGLDLQGGVQLVLGVDTTEAVENKLGRIGTELPDWAKEKGMAVQTSYVVKGQAKLHVEVAPGTDPEKFKTAFSEAFRGLKQEGNISGNTVEFSFIEDRIKDIKAAAIDQAERVVRSRVDKWGVAEPIISRRADNSVLVQLPGFKDPEKAKEFLGRTAQLKFKIVDDDFNGFASIVGKLPENIKAERDMAGYALVSEDRTAIVNLTKGLVPADKELLFSEEVLAGGKTLYRSYVVKAATELTGEDVLDAFVTVDNSQLDQRPVVSMQFTGPGGKRFENITGANVRRRMAIVLDDVIQSAPVIQQKISGGSAQITLGSGSGYDKIIEEANQLSLILKSGALPATIKVLEERQVGASLGPELASQGIRSTAVGLIFVFAFIVFYYRRPGLIASLALLLNGVFLLALMAMFNFSLSLPGIAGFILTLGMAVDANVLINERIRQELREGKNGRKALELGFQRVFWTIVDSNATSLIAATVLLQTNSSGPIRGFAITLLLGLLVSLFTSLYCSRLMFDWIVARCKTEREMRIWLGGSAEHKEHKPFQFNFLSKAPLAIGLPVLLVALSLITLSTKGMNWAVDFAGGTEVEVKFSQPVDSSDLEDAARKAGISDVTIQALGGGQKQYLLRFDRDEMKAASQANGMSSERSISVDSRTDKFKANLMTDLSSAIPEILRVDYVGPQVGKELRTQGAVSLVYALIGIVLYIMLRFDIRFAPGSVVKMIVDILVVLGFYVLAQRSFDLTSIAALLTVAGYTVNDCVVIYDRIRENLELHPRRPLRENVNNAINETLGRSINTSVCTLLSLFGIIFFATGSIWNFAVAMAVGVVAATWSSTFLATMFVVWFEGWKKSKALPGKAVS